MNDLTDPRHLSLSGKLKWGLGVLAVLAFGAGAWLFTLSMISIGIAGTVTLVIVHGAPWLSQKLAHFFLDLRKQDEIKETTGTHPAWQGVSADNKGNWPYYDLPTQK